MCNYGTLHLRINEILEEKGISKNKICKDTNLICKLCNYLDINIEELIEYRKPYK